jgi:threonine/homoserine efflux transporter RhtA
MREITQVVLAAVGLAVLLPLATVVAFRFHVGVPFVAGIFVLVALFVVLQNRLGDDAEPSGE